MTEELSDQIVEQERARDISREIQPGAPDEFDLALAKPQEFPTWPKPTPGEPALVGNILVDGSSQTGLQIWGMVTEDGGFDKAGIVLTPTVRSLQEAIDQKHFIGIQAGNSEGDNTAVLGSNRLTQERLGAFMDAGLYQLAASVTPAGRVRLMNLDPGTRVSIVRSEQPGDKFGSGAQKEAAEHAAEVFEVAEEAGEVAVEANAAIEPKPLEPSLTPQEAWGEATHHHSGSTAAAPASSVLQEGPWKAVSIPLSKEGQRDESTSAAEQNKSGLNLADRINEGVSQPAAVEKRPVLNLDSQINNSQPSGTEVPKLNLDSDGEEAVKEQERDKAPDMEAIFASGTAFEQAMNDQQLDPNVKTGLRRLAESWKNLQIAATTTEVWDGMIKPKLEEVSDIVPTLKGEVDNVASSSDQLAQLFDQAARALEDKDIQTFREAIGRAADPNQLLRKAFDGNEVRGSEDLQRAVTLLSREEVEGDDRIRLITRPAEYGALNEADADKFIAEVAPMVHSVEDITGATESLNARVPENQGNWRQRQQIIQEAAMFARAANSGVVVDPRNIARLRDSLDLASEALARGNYTPDIFGQVAANARQVHQSYEQVHRTLIRTMAELQALQ